MSDPFVNIRFDGFETEIAPLKSAGLAQGSLVDLDFHGGSSVYIDDYFRWRAGRTTEDNLEKMQAEDIPCIMA
jgi:hypothetical protein